MSDSQKYELLINELSAIELQAEIISSKCIDLQHRNDELSEINKNLKFENENLILKVNALEKEIAKLKAEPINEGLFSNISGKEKDELKAKLNEMILKINNHISSF